MTPAYRPLDQAKRRYRKDMKLSAPAPVRGKMLTDALVPNASITIAARFSLSVSWPDSSLMQNRNSGRHWAYSNEAKTTQRQEAYLHTRQALTMAGVEPSAKGRYRVTMRFYPPDNRRRDVSNLHAAMKAALDGIADAMEVDDSTFIEHAQSMGPIHKDGRVDISVEVLS